MFKPNVVNLPKTFQWLAFLGLFFLTILILYRLSSYFLLQVNLEGTSFLKPFITGLRFDLRWVAIILLPAIFVSLLPGFHFFRTRVGKHSSLYVFTIISPILLLGIGYDFLTQMVFEKRLGRETLNWIFAGQHELKIIYNETPWLVVLILAGVGTWLAYRFASLTHRALRKGRTSQTNKRQRLFWKIAAVLLLAFLIYGSLNPRPLNMAELSRLSNDAARTWALNPFQSLFSSF